MTCVHPGCLVFSDTPADRRRTVGSHYINFASVTHFDTQVFQCNASNIHGYIFTNVILDVIGEIRGLHELRLRQHNLKIDAWTSLPQLNCLLPDNASCTSIPSVHAAWTFIPIYLCKPTSWRCPLPLSRFDIVANKERQLKFIPSTILSWY